RSAKSQYRPRTCLYQHRAAALAGGGSLGNANANNGARFTCRQGSKRLCRFWWKGDTGPLKSMLSQVPAGTDPDGSVTSCRWDVAMIDRDFGEARNVLQKSELDEVSYTPSGTTPKSFFQGLIELAEGKQAEAQKLFE